MASTDKYKHIRKRVNDINQDPELRRIYRCPVLGENADLGSFSRKQMQNLRDQENAERTIRSEDIARYNLISTTKFLLEETSNLPNPGVTGEVDQ